MFLDFRKEMKVLIDNIAILVSCEHVYMFMFLIKITHLHCVYFNNAKYTAEWIVLFTYM